MDLIIYALIAGTAVGLGAAVAVIVGGLLSFGALRLLVFLMERM